MSSRSSAHTAFMEYHKNLKENKGDRSKLKNNKCGYYVGKLPIISPAITLGLMQHK